MSLISAGSISLDSAFNQWKNFLTNMLKNIIWHLFAGESHQVVKITVTYCAHGAQIIFADLKGTVSWNWFVFLRQGCFVLNGLIFKLYRGPNDFIMQKSVFLAGNANTSWLIMFIMFGFLFLKKKKIQNDTVSGVRFSWSPGLCCLGSLLCLVLRGLDISCGLVHRQQSPTPFGQLWLIAGWSMNSQVASSIGTRLVEERSRL